MNWKSFSSAHGVLRCAHRRIQDQHLCVTHLLEPRCIPKDRTWGRVETVRLNRLPCQVSLKPPPNLHSIETDRDKTGICCGSDLPEKGPNTTNSGFTSLCTSLVSLQKHNRIRIAG